MKIFVDENEIWDIDHSKLISSCGSFYVFPCGCRFKIANKDRLIHGQHYPVEYDLENINFNCESTWKMISAGYNKGLFQLESSLGKHWSKAIKPENIEDLAATTALLRPGCVSHDTCVMIKYYGGRKSNGRIKDALKIRISELYEKFQRNHNLYQSCISTVNEESLEIFNNKIDNVIYTGKKEVYCPKIRILSRNAIGPSPYYRLECTLDHLILTHNRGWIKLEDLEVGERVAVLNITKKSGKLNNRKLQLGERSFRDICYQNYDYKCVFCDWNLGSLDVNHLKGNRKSNNKKENLCFLCPNHHRMYSEGTITKEEVETQREKYTLNNTKDILWGVFDDVEYMGEKDTFDIKVEGPHHNFIAGNVVVHNCLNAKDERGVSMTELYSRRKNGIEEATNDIPTLEKLLAPTQFVMTYQEQLMGIARELADFNLIEVDELRKAAGKKLQDLMEKIGIKFIERATAKGLVTEQQARDLFANMKKSGRYLFCQAHATAYAINSYKSGHWKCHWPLYFFTSYLAWASEKIDPMKEVRQLIAEAQRFDIEVIPPRIEDMRARFGTDGKVISFGLCDIKGVGEKCFKKFKDGAGDIYIDGKFGINQSTTWYDFLIYFSDLLPSSAMQPLCQVGAFRNITNKSRQRLLAEYEAWSRLSPKEQEGVRKLSYPIYQIEPIKETYCVEDIKWPAKFKKADKESALEQLGEDGCKAEWGTKPVKKTRSTGETRIVHNNGIPVVLHEPKNVLDISDALTYILEREVVQKSRIEQVKSIKNLLDNSPAPLVDSPNWVSKAEESLLGLPLTISMVEATEFRKTNCTIKQYLDGWNPEGKKGWGSPKGEIVIGAEVQEIKTILIKNGDNRGRNMAKIVLQDHTGTIEEVIMFPDAYDQYSHLILRPNTIAAFSGQRSYRDGTTFVIEAIHSAE